jgi:hypothetical protein
MTVFWDIAPCRFVEIDRRFRRITLIMEAIRASETSVYFSETTRTFYVTQLCVVVMLSDG